ncbi:MAG: hypothetical protein MPJ79_06635 [Alphaproteobacteria bacterium]|nr:hypothetical protein [Alphaproteobacteria bacterium]MDA7983779.1 hypothetical protein [Alphaproteobacteria bacterium]MDA7989479.1 hypothetical protein [Alphaproteobacteria bacterium]MDA8008611.1 hypothetical protein [Alphaproteobacteria bacterium]
MNGDVLTDGSRTQAKTSASAFRGSPSAVSDGARAGLGEREAVTAPKNSPATETATATETPPDSESGMEATDPVGVAMRLAPEAVERLRAAGLTEEQLSLVLSLAEAQLMPMLLELGELRECESERVKLVRYFGGEEAWRRAGADLLRWGRASLPEDLFGVLSSSAEGIKAMQQLRESGREPSLIGGSDGDGDADDEASLRRMMSDPRYWRGRDPALVSRVREGWRRIYPS